MYDAAWVAHSSNRDARPQRRRASLIVLLVYGCGLMVFYSMSVRTDDEGRLALRGRQHRGPIAPLFAEEAAASDKAARANAKAPKVLRKAFATVL